MASEMISTMGITERARGEMVSVGDRNLETEKFLVQISLTAGLENLEHLAQNLTN